MRRRELILFLGGAFAQKAPILIGFLGNQAAPPKGDAQGNAIIQGFIDNGLPGRLRDHATSSAAVTLTG